MNKELSRGRLRDAVRCGKIAKPQTCDICGNKTPAKLLHGHHDDYDKPLSVVWSCISCHNAHHLRDVTHYGEDNPFSKLTRQNVIDIRSLREQGFSLAQIARQFRVSVATACQVAKGRTWKHLSGGVEGRETRRGEKPVEVSYSHELQPDNEKQQKPGDCIGNATPAQNLLPVPDEAEGSDGEDVQRGNAWSATLIFGALSSSSSILSGSKDKSEADRLRIDAYAEQGKDGDSNSLPAQNLSDILDLQDKLGAEATGLVWALRQLDRYLRP